MIFLKTELMMSELTNEKSSWIAHESIGYVHGHLLRSIWQAEVGQLSCSTSQQEDRLQLCET